MIFCSCQGLHGCVPVAPSAIPSPSASASSCARRSASLALGLVERLAAAGLDLDLGGDQLADDVALEVGSRHGGQQLLEAVHEPERVRVEERELLLDREREVLAVLELLAGRA